MNKNSGMLDYFSVLVIGNNPDDKIVRYDSMKDSKTPYIIYNYSDLNSIRKNRIKIYETLLTNVNNKKAIETVKQKIEELKSMSDIEYYIELGELYGYDENRNIISTENPEGKWVTCEKGGRIFPDYMVDINGNGVISGEKDSIDWVNTHLRKDKVETYNRTWDLCVNKIKPETDKDKNIVNNMKLHSSYFDMFSNKEEYVKMSCSFWTYAVITENGEWVDMENETDTEWVINFYDRFIKKLKGKEILTIYECTK